MDQPPTLSCVRMGSCRNPTWSSGLSRGCLQNGASPRTSQYMRLSPSSFFDSLSSDHVITPSFRFLGFDRTAQGWRSSLATSAVHAAWLDASLEPIIGDLRTNGELDRTLTIFTADHGAFFAGKGHPYEAGIRVPLFMHWPATLQQPRTLDNRVTHLDLLPTIASIAGARPVVGTHGASLDWLWRGAVAEGPADDAPLFIEVGYSRTVVTGGWKLIVVVQPPLGEHSPALAPSEGDSSPTCRTIHGMSLPNTTVEGAHRMRVKFLYDALERHPRHHCDNEQLYDLRRTRAHFKSISIALAISAYSPSCDCDHLRR